jgi:outer membrane lipoprotein-sorting protein
MTVENPNNTKDIQEGSLVLKGKKYKVTLVKKIKDKLKKEEYRNDTKVTCNYSEQNGEVTVDNAPDPNKSNAKNGLNPADLFTIHEKGFKYSFEKETTLNGRVVQIINLYPEKPDGKSYHTIKVTIDKLKKQVISMTMLNTNGSKITCTIKTFTPNLQMNDNEFEFDLKNYPPGTEVIDLREE